MKLIDSFRSNELNSWTNGCLCFENCARLTHLNVVKHHFLSNPTNTKCQTFICYITFMFIVCLPNSKRFPLVHNNSWFCFASKCKMKNIPAKSMHILHHHQIEWNGIEPSGEVRVGEIKIKNHFLSSLQPLNEAKCDLNVLQSEKNDENIHTFMYEMCKFLWIWRRTVDDIF